MEAQTGLAFSLQHCMEPTFRDATENTGYSHLPRITQLHGHLPGARILVQKGKTCFKLIFALPGLTIKIFERKMQMG